MRIVRRSPTAVTIAALVLVVVLGAGYVVWQIARHGSLTGGGVPDSADLMVIELADGRLLVSVSRNTTDFGRLLAEPTEVGRPVFTEIDRP